MPIFLPYPESTGRETFTDWLLTALNAFSEINAAGCSANVTGIYRDHCTEAVQPLAASAGLYLCGGGAHNPLLCQRIAALLPDWQVTSTASLGMHPDWVEAIAFAWLAHCFCERRPGNLPAVTGASRKSILGAFYPAN